MAIPYRPLALSILRIELVSGQFVRRRSTGYRFSTRRYANAITQKFIPRSPEYRVSRGASFRLS
jgi:hypothetical protein